MPGSTSRASSDQTNAVPARSRVDAGMFLTPAETLLLSDEVVDRLRDSILKGMFVPGDRLREEQLAEALGVSRGPIRNALLQLEREGLVIRRRNRGAIVAQLAREDLDEVYSLRQAIEPLACEWAARNASEADIAEMRAIVAGYSRLNLRATVQQAADIDLGFHDVIYRAARHRRLESMWQDLRPQVYVFLLARTYVRTREFRDIMIANHEALIDVVAARDEQRAREAAAAHVQTSYLRVIEGYGSESDTSSRG